MGPGKDSHGTLGPLRRKAVGGPINAPQGEVTHNDGALKRDNRQVFRQTQLENTDSLNNENNNYSLVMYFMINVLLVESMYLGVRKKSGN